MKCKECGRNEIYCVCKSIQTAHLNEIHKRMKVMQAYLDGKTIETSVIGSGIWVIVEEPEFNFKAQEYRVKADPKYRAYTFEEIPVGKVVKFYKGGMRCLIQRVRNIDKQVDVGEWITFEGLLKYWTFEDGSICGVLEV